MKNGILLAALALGGCTDQFVLKYDFPRKAEAPRGPFVPPKHPEGFVDSRGLSQRRPNGSRWSVERAGIRVEVLQYDRAHEDRGPVYTLVVVNERPNAIVVDFDKWKLAVPKDPARVALDPKTGRTENVAQEFIPAVAETPEAELREAGVKPVGTRGTVFEIPSGASLTRELSWNFRWAEGLDATLRMREIEDAATQEKFDLDFLLNEL